MDLWCRGKRVKEELKLIDIELERIKIHVDEDIEKLKNAQFVKGFETDIPIAYTFAKNQKIKKLFDYQNSNIKLIKNWSLKYK